MGLITYFVSRPYLLNLKLKQNLTKCYHIAVWA